MSLLRKYRRTLILPGVSFSLLTLFLPVFAQEQEPTAYADIEALTALNQGYLIAYRRGDTHWFDDNLAEDFQEAAPDGTLLNKEQFLEKIERRAGGDAQDVRAAELMIRLYGDVAIVNAIPEVTSSSGVTLRGGRYTDAYYRVEGRWLCVTAHLGGS